MKRELTKSDFYSIAGECKCSHVTVANAYAGKPIRQASFDRICQAAESLGLPKPKKVIAGKATEDTK